MCDEITNPNFNGRAALLTHWGRQPQKQQMLNQLS